MNKEEMEMYLTDQKLEIKDNPAVAFFYEQLCSEAFIWAETVFHSDEKNEIIDNGFYAGIREIDQACMWMEAVKIHFYYEKYQSRCSSSVYERSITDLIDRVTCEKIMCIQNGKLPELDRYKENNGFSYFMADHSFLWDGDADHIEHMSVLSPLKVEWSDYDYFSLKTEMDHIISLCEFELKKSKTSIIAVYPEEVGFQYPPKKRKETKIKKEGYVYLMRTEVHQYTKIGWSVNPKARERTLQGEDPGLFILARFKTTSDSERKLHKKYKNKRKRGEWFDLTPRDIDEIQEFFNKC